MTSVVIYVDESGDTGWKFDAPYRQGGSSRYLTIAALLVPTEKKHIPKRLIQKMYKQYNWPSHNEKKWTDLSPSRKRLFAQATLNISQEHAEIKYLAITAYKENVQDHIRQDSNKLYNYMICLLLVKEMAKYDTVYLMPDERAIKIESGNSLHDYLVTELWFREESKTELITSPSDSSNNRGIQFADMLVGLIQSYFEDSENEAFNILSSKLSIKRLYHG